MQLGTTYLNSPDTALHCHNDIHPHGSNCHAMIAWLFKWRRQRERFPTMSARSLARFTEGSTETTTKEESGR